LPFGIYINRKKNIREVRWPVHLDISNYDNGQF
jgi:hypothetical protein